MRPAHTAVSDALVAEGVDVVFGLMGDANMHLIVDLVERCGVRFVPVRHEATAVLAADGYRRASGRVGVATVTQGPGLANTATALTVARHARAPVILLAGAPATTDLDNVQRFDQAAFSAAAGARFLDVSRPELAGRQVRRAFLAARTGDGPAVLNLPVDVQDAPRIDETYEPSSRFLPTRRPGSADPGLVQELADLLAGAERPVLVAGRGALTAAASVREVARRCGALLATTLPAKGLFTGDPFDLGVVGGVALASTRAVLVDADLLVGVGAGLNRFTVDTGRLAPHARLALVTDHAHVVDRPSPPQLVVLGDAQQTMTDLLEALPAATGWRTDALAAKLRTVAAYVPVPDETGLDPRHVVEVCNAHLPAARSAVIGIGHFGGWPAQYLHVPEPGTLHLPWEFGSIGVGLPYGLGVAVARPELTTVVFEGDGSLFTNVGELDTLAREAAGVLVVVMDDSAYGAEVRKMQLAGLSTEMVEFPARDLAGVARLLGCEAMTASCADELAAVLRKVGTPRAPTVVHVPVTRAVQQAVF